MDSTDSTGAQDPSSGAMESEGSAGGSEESGAALDEDLVWETTLPYSGREPTVVRDVAVNALGESFAVVSAGPEHSLYALGADGDVLWSRDFAGPRMDDAALATDGDVVAFARVGGDDAMGAYDYTVYDSETGAELTGGAAPARFQTVGIAVQGARVVVTSGADLEIMGGTTGAARVDAYDVDTGTLEWSWIRSAVSLGSDVALDDSGNVFVVGRGGTSGFSVADGWVARLSPDGALVWELLFDDRGDETVALGLDGTIYLQSKIEVSVLSPDGDPLAHFDLASVVPSSGGKIRASWRDDAFIFAGSFPELGSGAAAFDSSGTRLWTHIGEDLRSTHARYVDDDRFIVVGVRSGQDSVISVSQRRVPLQ